VVSLVVNRETTLGVASRLPVIVRLTRVTSLDDKALICTSALPVDDASSVLWLHAARARAMSAAAKVLDAILVMGTPLGLSL
jgi:hypothetical protein